MVLTKFFASIHPDVLNSVVQTVVEGAEREIFLSSDCSWLRRTKILIVELHDRLVPGCSEALERALSPYSFRRTVKGENTILINNDLVA